MHYPHHRATERRSRLRWLVAVTAAVLALPVLPAVAAGQPPVDPPPAASPAEPEDNYDARQDADGTGGSTAELTDRAGREQALRTEVGGQAVVQLDDLTGTPRVVSTLDGFLTGPSPAPAAEIVLGYLREHLDEFGLTDADVDRLELRRDYRDVAGLRHVSFRQVVDGVPVFGNGIKGDVGADGSLISVSGSPVAALPAVLPEGILTAQAARERAISDRGATADGEGAAVEPGPETVTTFGDGDTSQKVVFVTDGGPRTAWQTVTSTADQGMYLHVLDAETGRVLYRQSLSSGVGDGGVGGIHATRPAPTPAPLPTPDATGDALVWDVAPGPQRPVSFTDPGWLDPAAATLNGNYAHVYSDVDNDNAPGPDEEITAGPDRFRAAFTDFTDTVGAPCSAVFPCSWNGAEPYSWQTNRAQSGAQLFHYLNTFRDHLAAAPIGFTAEAGNFEAAGGDAVQGELLNGADLAGGLPDGNNRNNANMSTPPDGTPPTMQMFLFHQPGSSIIDSNSADDAEVVYHEYTHGLSNRLVVDVNGVSTLNSAQSRAMGEAWSDWYAESFLVDQGLVTDTAADGELTIGDYVFGNAVAGIRTQAMDCAVGSTVAACPGTSGAGPGGYTYGDFATVRGGPRVHSDGEIWAATLWDLRTALGSEVATSLVTRAMELAPADPTYLDMRNAILQADNAVRGGAARDAIWSVFAGRGMGFFAGAFDAADIAPVEDFSLPPAPGSPTGSLTGRITDARNGAPLAGVVVGLGGHDSGFAGEYVAVSDADGRYRIDEVAVGSYPKVRVRGAAGYEPQVAERLAVDAGENVRDWSLRRNWAADAGGGSVAAFTGTDFTQFGCGPAAALDQAAGTGWVSDVLQTDGVMAPREIVIALPAPITVGELAIDPAAGCGLDASSATAGYRIDTSTDGTSWTPAAEGAFTTADQGAVPVAVAPGAATGVAFLRFTVTSAQVPGGQAACESGAGDTGCAFVGVAEVAVYGDPA